MTVVRIEELRSEVEAGQRRLREHQIDVTADHSQYGGSGGGGDMQELARRVGTLEGEVKEARKDLGTIRERLAAIEGKISNMPTTFQMATWFVGVAVALVGLTFAIARIVVSH